MPRSKTEAIKAYTVLASPEGQEMLNDLLHTFVYRDQFTAGDPHLTSHHAGQASVVLYMLRKANPDVQADLLTALKEEEMFGGPPH